MNRILHLGLGRFHRGHQAVCYQRSGGWKVTATTMRSSDERDKLRGVDLRYPVLELTHDSEKLTWIDAIDEALSLREDLPRLREVFTSEQTKIITLTVTEKGYCLDSSGELDQDHAGIRHDLQNPGRPETAIGLLALGLSERPFPVTVISCDNLRSNGEKLGRAVERFLTLAGKDARSVLRRTSFPNTMVDRIVPSLLPEKVVELEARYGLGRSELIATEKFSQWVIEDKFVTGRPEWAGVEIVSDVKPYEEMKLRLLNASHSYLAYAGLNRGYQYVHEAIRNEELLGNISRMMNDEVIPLLVIPSGFDVQAYVVRLIERFRNDKLPHQLRQIAMDGSQKMPQRIFSSITEAVERKAPSQHLRDVVNEWLEFLWNERNGKIEDPKAGEILRNLSAGREHWKAGVLSKFGL